MYQIGNNKINIVMEYVYKLNLPIELLTHKTLVQGPRIELGSTVLQTVAELPN